MLDFVGEGTLDDPNFPVHPRPANLCHPHPVPSSTWDNAEIERLLSTRVFPGFTEKTRDTLPKLLSDLEAIRTRGWSIDDEEHTLGMCCLAAPIFNEYGEAIAGISVSGSAVRLPDGKLTELGPVVRAAAVGVTRAMGDG